MFPLYLAQDLLDAQMLMDELEDAGIEAAVQNSDTQAAIGELPWGLQPQVCVLNETDLDRATTLKKEYESRRAQSLTGEERRCDACGELSPPNFEVCWKCREPFAATPPSQD
jgi:hypothetical protein